uniref:tRNA N(3)-methylcytidine methyltransferase n=1 Tax=Glossina brevipalpis TaxID=37001 RepID=A0A1A9WD23_9MUSC
MCEVKETVKNLARDEDLDKRPKFGNRFLTNEEDVFKHNAWDNVEWDDEQENQASQAVYKNSSKKMDQIESAKFKLEADKYWDSFYEVHQHKFFKDRHWLFTEFPELTPKDSSQRCRAIFELGCGVGNTLLPILKYSAEEELKVYGCDFSSTAIEILRSNPEFDHKRCDVFVMDATLENWTVPFEKGSQDIIIMIFVLSAMEPAKMQLVVNNCYQYLKPGGLVLLRDYGRYDLAQLRFKSGKCLEDNFYVRGDGTLVYFFTQSEIRDFFAKAGFIEEQNVVDRRLQVNRSRMLKMYRVWVQAKYRKPLFDKNSN